MRVIIGLMCLLCLVGGTSSRVAATPLAAPDTGWVDLFNGKDFSGWEVWLNRAPGATQPLGLNNDPLGVFKVEDGAIHVSGQVAGALTTLEAYDNYHLVLEQKWGERKWPPRQDRPRDSGILYHAFGPHGAFAGSWMRGLQFQIGEGSTGEHWNVGGPTVNVEARAEGNDHRYKPGGTAVVSGRNRILAGEAAEEPLGEWNRLELIVRGDSATYVVNGKVVMKTSNARYAGDGTEVPLTSGKIQLQSELSEVWFRHIRLKRLDP